MQKSDDMQVTVAIRRHQIYCSNPMTSNFTVHQMTIKFTADFRQHAKPSDDMQQHQTKREIRQKQNQTHKTRHEMQ